MGGVAYLAEFGDKAAGPRSPNSGAFRKPEKHGRRKPEWVLPPPPPPPLALVCHCANCSSHCFSYISPLIDSTKMYQCSHVPCARE